MATVFPPTVLAHAGNDLQVAAIIASRVVMREIKHVFPAKSFALDDHVIVLPTCQRSQMELVNWGDDVAVEKDRLLEVFAAFAKEICDELVSLGHWADFIDPCSGLPTLTEDCTSVYDEVASMQALLKYEISQAGPCKVLIHPTWGSAVYPATCFTSAPADILLNALAKYQKFA